MITEPGSLAGDPGGEVPAGRPKRTPAQIGKANSRKGKKHERDVVNFLRVNGFRDAKRLVRTGFRNSGNFAQDEGDICGTPGLAWQVKATAETEWWKIPQWLAATQSQRDASGADYGILVLKRKGHAHPGSWWAHLYLADMVALLGVPREDAALALSAHVPIRLEFAHLVPVLHRAGYGDPEWTPLTPADMAGEPA